MKIHEYQAKQILLKYGVPVQNGIPIKDMSKKTSFIVHMKNVKNQAMLI